MIREELSLKIPDPRMVKNLNELDSLLWVFHKELIYEVFVLGGHLWLEDDICLLSLGEFVSGVCPVGSLTVAKLK